MNIISLSYANDNVTLCFAANELARHLQTANPAFHFVESQSPDTALQITLKTNISVSEDDAFQIDITQKSGSITGNNARSVLLGVYHYLRTLGFVFLAPAVTHVPQGLTLQNLFCTYEKKASLRHRGVCIEGADLIENILDFIDWLPKLGFNTFFLQFHRPFTFLDRYYETHTQEYETELALLKKQTDETGLSRMPDVSSDLKNRYGEEKAGLYESFYLRMLQAAMKRSLLLHTVGHGWTCAALSLPSVGWVTESSEPDETMRALIACVDGKRTYSGGVPLNTNLCYSNPDAVRAFVKAVTDYATQNPQVDYIHVWLADEPNHICECDACRKEHFTDQYVRLLNQIDAALSAKNISCKLVFLLYQELLYPPVRERLLHPERFVLMFAPISRTFSKSYPTRITPVQLPMFKRNRMKLPVSIEENLSYLHGWQACFAGDSLDYDYPLGRAHYGDFGYIHIARTIFHDIESLPALSLNGYLSCQELRICSPNALPNYVMGYKLFDMGEDFDTLCTEYFNAAYGNIAPQVRTYLESLSTLSDCDYFNGIGPRMSPATAAAFQKIDEELRRFQPLLKERLAASSEDTTASPASLAGISDPAMAVTALPHPKYNCPPVEIFLRILRFHAHYSKLLARALGALAGGENTAARDAYLQFKKYILENENEFEPFLDVWRILEIAEKYTGFQAVLSPETNL